MNGNELARPAVVFAPHQDDETLGCGGTIVKKRRAGAQVSIVFLTDGGRSHSHLMPRAELTTLRAQEAVAASRILGVGEKNVAFLHFEDAGLEQAEDAAVERVREFLASRRPEQVFTPYYKDSQGDHLTANRIVRAALTACGETVDVFEYPVWFWTHWPWANLPLDSRSEIVDRVKQSVVSGWSLLRDFRCAVFVGDVLQIKRAALDQYKSQMTRLVPSPRWLTLSDVANGRFLGCFFQDREIFHRYCWPGGRRGARAE